MALLQEQVDLILGPQNPIGSSWFDTTQVAQAKVHGVACPVTPPSDTDAQVIQDGTLTTSFNLLHYYDLAQAEYAAFARTGDTTFQALARKCADSWWQHPQWIGAGNIRLWAVAGNEQATPVPRQAGIGGLILRALDGRPEMWPWINDYCAFSFQNWCKRRIADNQLLYLREAAFSLHYIVWLAKCLPDSFGTQTNGATLRAQYLADAELVATNYFGRLQGTDGSYRWNDPDYTDTDGGTLQGVTQPFIVGILMLALIDLHRLSTNQTVRDNIQNQITKACRHLYSDGPYRKDDVVPADTTKRFRSFWYFYHGGTTVNPTKYEKGGGSYDGSELWMVKSERQSIGLIVPVFGYAYQLTKDSFFKTAGDELWDAAYIGTDGIRNEMDGTAKNYNQDVRRGGSYIPWRDAAIASTPIPNPTPTPLPTPAPRPVYEYLKQPFSSEAQFETAIKNATTQGYGSFVVGPTNRILYCVRIKQ